MNADLLRQRRNLIGISAILLIFDFANVQIAKVSLLGTKLLVGNVQVLAVCAWVICFYFLIRYYQYLCAEPDSLIRNSFINRLDKYSRSHIVVVDQDQLGHPFSYRICRVSFAKQNYVNRKYDPARGDVSDGIGDKLPLRRIAICSFKTAGFVSIQTPYATDRLFPSALAIAASIVTVYTKLPYLYSVFVSVV